VTEVILSRIGVICPRVFYDGFMKCTVAIAASLAISVALESMVESQACHPSAVHASQVEGQVSK
jgi:hypothetical protein